MTAWENTYLEQTKKHVSCQLFFFGISFSWKFNVNRPPTLLFSVKLLVGTSSEEKHKLVCCTLNSIQLACNLSPRIKDAFVKWSSESQNTCYGGWGGKKLLIWGWKCQLKANWKLKVDGTKRFLQLFLLPLPSHKAKRLFPVQRVSLSQASLKTFWKSTWFFFLCDFSLGRNFCFHALNQQSHCCEKKRFIFFFFFYSAWYRSMRQRLM